MWCYTQIKKISRTYGVLNELVFQQVIDQITVQLTVLHSLILQTLTCSRLHYHILEDLMIVLGSNNKHSNPIIGRAWPAYTRDQ